ncbi:uncharacterized protein GBIM_18166 [Gryllus bimaculatus]|nr:uncharacterized protein GBIM_18166 [Gryllus bimaculatus]
MDPTVAPCEDFYRYACGRWPDHHPTPDSAISHDWFAEQFLRKESTGSEPLPVQQARRLYKSCNDRVNSSPIIRMLSRNYCVATKSFSAKEACKPEERSTIISENQLIQNELVFLHTRKIITK